MIYIGTGQQIQMMAKPATIPGCPPGLEYLTQLDQIIIKQQIELLESKLIISSTVTKLLIYQ